MEWTEKLVYSSGIPAVPRNRKLLEFRCEPLLEREKCLEFCTVGQKWSKPLGFHSEPFLGREKCSENAKKWEQTLVIPFRTIPLKRIQLGIPFRGTKIEPNSWNSVSMHLTTFELWTNYFVELFWLFLKTNFLRVLRFHSIPSFGIDSSVNLGMCTFFRGITETVPSLFRGIFSERNSVANPTWDTLNLRILASSNVLFRPAMVQMTNLALVETKRITVYVLYRVSRSRPIEKVV